MYVCMLCVRAFCMYVCRAFIQCHVYLCCAFMHMRIYVYVHLCVCVRVFTSTLHIHIYMYVVCLWVCRIACVPVYVVRTSVCHAFVHMSCVCMYMCMLCGRATIVEVTVLIHIPRWFKREGRICSHPCYVPYRHSCSISPSSSPAWPWRWDKYLNDQPVCSENAPLCPGLHGV